MKIQEIIDIKKQITVLIEHHMFDSKLQVLFRSVCDLEQSLSKDIKCEHEFEPCPAVKCEHCGLIIED